MDLQLFINSGGVYIKNGTARFAIPNHSSQIYKFVSKALAPYGAVFVFETNCDFVMKLQMTWRH